MFVFAYREATQLVSLLQDDLNMTLPATLMFDHPTTEAISTAIKAYGSTINEVAMNARQAVFSTTMPAEMIADMHADSAKEIKRHHLVDINVAASLYMPQEDNPRHEKIVGAGTRTKLIVLLHVYIGEIHAHAREAETDR